MLNEEQKERIREEERFRFETQNKLKSNENKLWDFLNSNFGIWLLSSVVLGLITWGYTKISSSIAENSKNKTEIIKHIYEVNSRLDTYIKRMSNPKLSSDYYYSNDCIINGQCQDNNISIFPEYSNKNIQALLVELSILVPSGKKKNIYNAIEELKELNKNKIQLNQNMTKGEYNDLIDQELKSNAENLLRIAKKIKTDINK